MKALVVLFIFFTVHILRINAQDNKLKVEILYESLCPDSLAFITQQLHPVWKDLSPYVDLKLTPFGKSASVDDGSQFICQHGPLECKGNRIQSCALNLIAHQDHQVEYANCFMKVFRKEVRNPEEFGQTCINAVGLNPDHVTKCYSTNEGTKLQLAAEQNTYKIAPSFIPTILYNGVFDQRLQDDSLVDFRKVVCGIVTQIHPDACQTSSVLRL